MPIRSSVFIISLLVIVIALVTFGEFWKPMSWKNSKPELPVVPGLIATSTPAPAPTPTPVPLPYDGISVGFAAARFSTPPPFLGPEYWSGASKFAAGKFEGSAPQGILVIGGILEGGTCKLNFPSSSQYAHIAFTETDENEEYLDYFDQHGISVILQVEPGLANVDTVLKLVLDQYANHPCLAGIGVDVEWHCAPMYWDGKSVTDIEAARWYRLINSYQKNATAGSGPDNVDSNKKYCLALTHYKTEKMPPTYREGIYFLYDGEGFSSLDDFMKYCIDWGNAFEHSDVGFYIGFPKDSAWWNGFDDPIRTVGDSLLKNIDNTKGVYWVGLSIRQILKE